MHQIVIVDDEPDILNSIISMLKNSNEDYLLRPASSGEVALRTLDKIRPDLIITDWQMPGMSGIELIREIRKRYSLQEVPVILVSGVMISSANLSEGLRSYATDFLRKPVDSEELLARVANSLRMKEMYAKLERQKKEIEQLLLNEKQYLKDQLLLKERQIKQVGKHLTEKHEQLTKFRSKVDELSELIDNEIRNIPEDNLIVSPEQEWATFRLQLESLQPNFFSVIQQFSPTPNEERMMAYIRVGLNSKEVASVMDLTVEAAKKARQRLRRKLDAGNDAELWDMLIKL